jgi:NADH dehydrogenase
MEITSVCVLGGSGFVGRHVCQQLAARGYRVRVPTRNRERAKQLILLPTVDVVAANVHDPEALSETIAGAEAVINLVGMLHDGRGEERFAAAHVELARKVVAACTACGVGRLLHMSALNADPAGPSAYLRSKGEAERIVRESGVNATILRPSVIFGPDDRFLNPFARALKFLPVMVLPCPRARFQPVYVEDVAAVFACSLEDLASGGKAYDLCGPRVYTLRDLVEYAGTVTGHRRPIIGLNDALSYAQARGMELPLIKQIMRAFDMLMTRDNFRSMEVDSVCGCALPFGLVPTALEAVAPAWLATDTSRARYQRFRNRAGR